MIFCFFAIIFSFKPVYAIEKSESTLILFDTYNRYGIDEDILNEVNIIAMKASDEVAFKNYKFYKEGDIFKYKNIIILNNNSDDIGKNLKSDLIKYKGKKIGIGQKVDGLNISLDDFSNSKIKSESQIIKYINGKGALDKEKFLVLEDVDAFMDLNSLIEKIDFLNNRGIPFILDVRPVYLNTDLSSMGKFCESLRYAQSKGGFIILDTPYIELKDKVTSKEVIDSMSLGYSKLVDYKVYPIAVTIPDWLMYRGELNDFLESSNTLFIKNDEKSPLEISEFNNPKIENIITYFNYSKDKNIEELKLGSDFAVAIKANIDNKEFEKNINNISDIVNFKNPEDLKTSIKIDGKEIKSSELGIYLNGSDVTQNRFINNEEFKKTISNTENKKEDTGIDISKFSKVVIMFAIVACGIFIIIAILSKKMDRKKYFK
ncbi:DUF2334 domain-containing protein [Clostridium chrysemydis]|uniref:DUF2334 domain-containing protein n=1 Tax=Clostridium chrysemydis TaxID=2665504 RepID=UPI0018845EC6|nr:DUF2334 domain-containing protein [Clostridium chrysemydis]